MNSKKAQPSELEPSESSDANGGSKKLRVLIGAAVVVVVALIAATLSLKPFVEGKVGDGLRELAGEYLRPTLEFEALRYQVPLGVEARDAKLVTDALEILTVERLGFTLGEIPRPGRPLRIEGLHAEGVTVRLARRGDAILGWSNFLLRPTDPKVKPSQVFRLREVELEGVELQWSTRPDEQLVIQGVDAKIDVDRSRADEGIYAIELASNRGKFVTFEAALTLDVNAFALDISELELNITIDEKTRKALPLVVRSFVDEHALEGTLKARVSGNFPIEDPLAGSLELSLEMRDFTMSLGDWSVPAKRLDLSAKLDKRKLSIEHVELEAIGGTLDADGSFDFNGETPEGEFQWKVSGVSLATALPGSDFAGKLSGSGSMRGPLDDLAGLHGSGRIRVDDGRLVSSPILRELVRRSDAKSQGRQSGSARFSLGSGAKSLGISDIEFEMPLLGIRGEGRVGFNGSLKLELRVGPMQQIEGDGPLRRALRSGGAIMQYCVDGTVGNPRVRPLPFGIGC